LSELDERVGAVAIVGMAGCFPGAANLEEFWRNLEQATFGRENRNLPAVDRDSR